MIGVNEALAMVLSCQIDYGNEEVSIHESIGRVLDEDVSADRDMPPFHRVTMDGIAIKFDAFNAIGDHFKVEDIAPAGSPQKSLKLSNHCIEVMTGAPLPNGTDTVIRYEDLDKRNDGFAINIEVKPDSNIHNQGKEHRAGEIVLSSGTEIKAIDINILASVGRSEVRVKRNPRVAIISSGDELVEISVQPEDHQIRRSNVHMIHARLNQFGIAAESFHFQDNPEAIYQEMSALLERFDVILMSGGVSMGKYDFIPAVLSELHFEKLFHKVAQRPGKPFWFGRKEDKLVFAFPGNPVSTLACFHKYFLPWYFKVIGKQQVECWAELEEDVAFNPDLTYFAQATMRFDRSGRVKASIKHGGGSGDISHPSKMDGFIELERGKTIYKSGEVYRFIPFYPILP